MSNRQFKDYKVIIIKDLIVLEDDIKACCPMKAVELFFSDNEALLTKGIEYDVSVQCEGGLQFSTKVIFNG